MSIETIVPTELSGRRFHVLVVEDNVALRFTLAEWLRILNYVVYEAANADEAATLLASPLLIDAVVTDVQMPGTMDGLGLVDYVERVAPSLPVIVVSANDVRQQLQGKRADFFLKPYDFDVLAGKIASVLRHTLESKA